MIIAKLLEFCCHDHQMGNVVCTADRHKIYVYVPNLNDNSKEYDISERIYFNRITPNNKITILLFMVKTIVLIVSLYY